MQQKAQHQTWSADSALAILAILAFTLAINFVPVRPATILAGLAIFTLSTPFCFAIMPSIKHLLSIVSVTVCSTLLICLVLSKFLASTAAKEAELFAAIEPRYAFFNIQKALAYTPADENRVYEAGQILTKNMLLPQNARERRGYASLVAKTYERAVALNPEQARYHYLLAIADLELNLKATALNEVMLAIDLEPHNPIFADLRTNILQLPGKLQ